MPFTLNIYTPISTETQVWLLLFMSRATLPGAINRDTVVCDRSRRQSEGSLFNSYYTEV